MLKSVLTMTLVAATLALGPTLAADAPAPTTKKCLMLSDSTASIYSALSFISLPPDLKNMPLHQLLAPLDKQVPWLSQCLASTDIMSIGMQILSDSEKTKCVSAFTGGSSSNSSAFGFNDEYFRESLCPSFKKSILPCVDTLVVDALEKLIVAGGECCADMGKQLKVLFGQDLKTFLPAIAKRVGDVLCSIRTYKDRQNNQKNETCGATIMEIVGSGQSMLDVSRLLQVPNEEGCGAMKGEEFKLANGDKYKFFLDQDPLDVCFAPLNLLLTDVAQLPLVTKSKFADIFAKGECMDGKEIIDWALSEESVVTGLAKSFDGIVTDMKLTPSGHVTKVVQNGIKDMDKDFGSMCFHLPNSVSDCVYENTVVYAYSADAPPKSRLAGDAPGDSKKGSGAPGLVTTASSALIVGAMTVVLYM